MEMSKNGVEIGIEILEFESRGNSYGADINDIREILPYNKKPTPIPNSHPFIEGIIKPRDFIIPIIDLMKSLKLKDIIVDDDADNQEMLIVTGITDQNIAFHVDSVKGIHKVMAAQLEKPGKKLSTSQNAVVSNVLKLEDKKIEILDLRKLISEINPKISFE